MQVFDKTVDFVRLEILWWHQIEIGFKCLWMFIKVFIRINDMLANKILCSLRSDGIKFHSIYATFSCNAVAIETLILFVQGFAERDRNWTRVSGFSLFLCFGSLLNNFLLCSYCLTVLGFGLVG